MILDGEDRLRAALGALPNQTAVDWVGRGRLSGADRVAYALPLEKVEIY